MADKELKLSLKLQVDAKDGRVQLDGAAESLKDLGQEGKKAAEGLSNVGKASAQSAASTKLAEREQKALNLSQLQVDISTARLTKDMSALTAAYAKQIVAEQGYSAAVARTLAQQKVQIEQQSKGATLLGGISGKAGIAVAGYLTASTAMNSGKALLDSAVGFDKIAKSLEAVTGSSAEAGQEFGFVRSEASRMGLSLREAAAGYTQLMAASKGTALEGEQTQQVFSAVSKASSALGLSAYETNGALLAIGQMMSKGTVQSEELRGQLGERLPGAFNIAARAMGVSTAELGKMLDAGKVISDEFLPKFATELDKTFGNARFDGLQNNINRLSTAWDLFKKTLADDFPFNSAIKALSSLMEQSTNAQVVLDIRGKIKNGTLGQATAEELQAGHDALVAEMQYSPNLQGQFKQTIQQVNQAQVELDNRTNEFIRSAGDSAQRMAVNSSLKARDLFKASSVAEDGGITSGIGAGAALAGIGTAEGFRGIRGSTAEETAADEKANKALAASNLEVAISDAKRAQDTNALRVAMVQQRMEQQGESRDIAEQIVQNQLYVESQRAGISAANSVAKAEETKRQAGERYIETLKAEIEEGRLSAGEGGLHKEIRTALAKVTSDQAAETERLVRIKYQEAEADKWLAQGQALERKARTDLIALRNSTGEAERLAQLAEGMRLQGATNEEIARQIELERQLGQVREQFPGIGQQEAMSLALRGSEAQRKLAELTEKNTDSLSEYAKRAAQNMESAFAAFLFDPFKAGAKGMAQSFGETVRRMLADAASAQLMQALFGKNADMAGGLLGSAFSSLGGLFGGGSSAPTPISNPGPLAIGVDAFAYPHANGGIMTAQGPLPLHRYASGGIANSAQLALFGEGRRPEAYVPLPDGRTIPVTLNAAAPPAPQSGSSTARASAGTIVQVINQTSGNVSVEKGTDPSGLEMIKVFVRDQVQQQFPGMMRTALASGSYDKDFRANYGVSRPGRR